MAQVVKLPNSAGQVVQTVAVARLVAPPRPRGQQEAHSKAPWVKIAVAGGAFILAIVLYVAAGHKPDGKQTTAAVDPAPESVAVVNPTPALTLTSVNVVVSTPTVTPTPVSAADSSPTSDTTEAAEQPPSPEPAESDTLATPKPQSEVEKWLAETDAKQQETFQQQVIKPYEAGLAALRARYLAALDAALLKASSAGQLDQSLVWRTEKQNFTVNQTIPADDATTAPEIRAMRADYRQKFAQLELERAARAKQLFTNYDAILLKNSTLLTQRKRLDDALLLHTKRKELAKAWGIESQQQPVTAQPATAQPAGVKPSTPAPSGKNQTSVSLLTLTPAKEPIIGYGELIQGKNDFYGDPVLVNGEPCTLWIGAHAQSKIVYKVPLGTKTFTAYGVRPNNRNIAGSWLYIVRFDGVQAYRSKPLNEYDNYQVLIEVPVPAGAKLIELAVDDMGSIRNDHSVWALPVLNTNYPITSV